MHSEYRHVYRQYPSLRKLPCSNLNEIRIWVQNVKSDQTFTSEFMNFNVFLRIRHEPINDGNRKSLINHHTCSLAVSLSLTNEGWQSYEYLSVSTGWRECLENRGRYARILGEWQFWISFGILFFDVSYSALKEKTFQFDFSSEKHRKNANEEKL